MGMSSGREPWLLAVAASRTVGDNSTGSSVHVQDLRKPIGTDTFVAPPEDETMGNTTTRLNKETGL